MIVDCKKLQWKILKNIGLIIFIITAVNTPMYDTLIICYLFCPNDMHWKIECEYFYNFTKLFLGSLLTICT